MSTSHLIQKLWNYCNVLRDDGMSYGDYVEQLTYLLFLKMADERTKAPYNQKSPVPDKYSWPSLIKKDGDELFDHYRHTLEALGNEKGLLGLIFNKSQNKFQDPAKLRRLIVDLIDKETLGVDERRREGRCLRRPAGEERAGHEVRRRPVLHPAPADPGHRGCHGAEARRDRLRPGLRHRRLSARGARLCGEAQRAPRPSRKRRSSRRKPSRAGSWCRPRRASAP